MKMSISYRGKFCKAQVCRTKIRDESCSKSFFRFPIEESRCKIWFERTGNKDLILNTRDLYRSSRLCGDHFERSQFTNDLKIRLNKNAIPTIFGDKIYELTTVPHVRNYFPRTLGRSEPVRAHPIIEPITEPALEKDKAFVAHKDILSKASPKLAAMLDRPDDDESGYTLLNFDLDEDVCCEMLRFIYLGQIGYVADKAKLLQVAKEFEVVELFEEMQRTIQLSVDNAVDMLLLAEQLDATDLKTNAIAFINSHSEAVMSTTGWNTMIATKPELLATLYRAHITSRVAAM